MLVAGLDTCYIDLFPFDWYIVCFEDCLDCLSDLGTDTITYSSTVKITDRSSRIVSHTWNEGHCIFSTKFRGLEDVGLYGCVC